MSIRTTVLCENTVFGHAGAIAEHGWAVWLETPAGNFLFDTGQGYGLLTNAALFGIDLTTANAILLSHHHFDHTGGLLNALRTLNRQVPVYSHPDLFKDSYHQTEDEERPRHIGIPFTRNVLEAAGADFHLGRGWSEMGEGVWMTGEVPRDAAFVPADPALKHVDTDGKLVPDPIMDDQTVVLETPEGLVVVLGCSHAGIVNILEYVARHTGRSRFHTVIGGTHLVAADDDQLTRTIKALQRFDIGRLGVSHCTGQKATLHLANAFGERFFFCNVGRITVQA
ncbi:MAG: MBL fold metallo-hydrolase [Chloroflexota bacterium]|nr:MBL fold metallo-hydrolase [Chloroflexota bacterium]